MKKKNLTKSQINEKLLNKYEVSLDELNYDGLKQFKERIKDLSDTRQKGKVKYKICPRRPGDIATCYSNPSKAEKELGWKAEKGIEQMCKDSWNYKSKNM